MKLKTYTVVFAAEENCETFDIKAASLEAAWEIARAFGVELDCVFEADNLLVDF